MIKQGRIVDSGKKPTPKTPQRKGEVSISGHMASLESDDNVKEAAKKVGLYGDKEKVEPVGVAEEVVEAEQEKVGDVEITLIKEE